MVSYNHQEIEKKWQRRWEEARLFEAKDDPSLKKFYCLIEFPYPSGAGLHIGHPRSYTALDVVARKRRMLMFCIRSVGTPLVCQQKIMRLKQTSSRRRRKHRDV